MQKLSHLKEAYFIFCRPVLLKIPFLTILYTPRTVPQSTVASSDIKDTKGRARKAYEPKINIQ